MKSKICMSTWSLVGLMLRNGKSVYDMIDIAADIGVDGIDFGEDVLRCAPYDSLHGLNQIRRYAHARGLEVLGTWFYTDLIAGVDTSSVKEVVYQLSNMLAKTSYLEAPFMCIPIGEVRAGMRYDEAHALNLEIFSGLLQTAREYGVRMVIETARSSGVIATPEYTLQLVKEINSDYLGIAPDFEAWRHATDDLPLVHVEAPGKVAANPTSLDVFRECMPYAPFMHAKVIGFDENGEEPHIPIPEMMQIINETPIPQILDIEYEGWIPDIHPELDAVAGVAKAFALFNKYLK